MNISTGKVIINKFPEIIKMVNEFRASFPDLKVEWCKEGNNERGTKLTGTSVIPCISDKVKNNDRNNK